MKPEVPVHRSADDSACNETKVSPYFAISCARMLPISYCFGGSGLAPGLGGSVSFGLVYAGAAERSLLTAMSVRLCVDDSCGVTPRFSSLPRRVVGTHPGCRNETPGLNLRSAKPTQIHGMTRDGVGLSARCPALSADGVRGCGVTILRRAIMVRDGGSKSDAVAAYPGGIRKES
jgi:hypothetical protein